MQDENVIIDNRFGVRLIDFGSAVVFQPGQLFATFYGTVEYCAPEVLKGAHPLQIVLLLRMHMDQIFIETPDPRCRLYWCLTEFIDWRYSQSCWYFRPLLWTCAHLTFSLIHLPPLPPFPVWISTGICIHTACNGVGDRGPQTDKHLPPSTFTGQYLRKAGI